MNSATERTPTPPVARRSQHTDCLHGISVPDPYRWMEETESSETRDWIASQRSHTEAWLQRIPHRPAIRAWLDRMSAYERIGLPIEKAGRLFHTVHDGRTPQAMLCMSQGSENPRVLVDPNAFSDDGTISIIDFSPSSDGRYVAYGLSEAGSDRQTWRIYDVDHGLDLEDVIRTKFIWPAWLPDGSGFFYQSSPETDGHWLRAEDASRSLMFHRLGTPQEEDTTVLSRPEEPDWLYSARTTDDGRFVVVTVSRGTFPETAVGVIELERGLDSFRWVLDGFDAQYLFLGNSGTSFRFLTTLDAPRKRIVEMRMQPGESDILREVVGQSEDLLEQAIESGDRIICTYLHHAAARIEIRSLDGELKAAPELPSEGTIWRLSASDDGRVGYVEYTDVGQPFTVLRLDSETGELAPFRDIALPFVAKDVVTERCFYAGEDGTRIPIFVSRSRKTQAGPDTPTLLYAYGGFGVSETPQFTLLHRAWIDMGGQLAVACIRGGNEYGEPWREAGVGKNRMTCYKDFCRAAEWLVEEGRTSTGKLVINGRSNGGLLVGACITMRPELFGAAVPAVGVHDMLRFHKFTVGRYWVSDFGSPDDPEVFPVLLGYSPVHNVRSGTAYPPTLVLTADHDDRVFPAHSYKFGAALQHAQSGDAPILVRIDHRAGHGFGRSIQQEQAEIADVLSFLVDVLGFQPRLDCEASD